MIRRIWTAYRVELAKVLRLKATYLGPALVAACVFGALLVRPVARDGASDYGFIAYATQVGQGLLGLLLLLAYSAGLISAELSSGTIRLALVRPVRRWEWLAAKLFLGITYAVALTASAGVTSWLIALVLGDIAGVSYGGEVVFTAQSMLYSYLLGAVLSLAPLSATVAYGVLFSTCTRNTGAATAAAIGIWVAVDTVKHQIGLGPYLFTTYLEMPWRVFAAHSEVLDASWNPDAKYCLLTSLVSFVAFALVAARVLARRNLTV
ncbi:MAG TPA: hypothetical protein ENN80_15385 [Candidatus Hydrogenedentes bacterium]|nr:hypothetical protein [Candidatus Hydrogenedentota bacterium]